MWIIVSSYQAVKSAANMGIRFYAAEYQSIRFGFITRRAAGIE